MTAIHHQRSERVGVRARLVCTSSIMALFISVAMPAVAKDVSFNISSQPLSDALLVFSRQSDILVAAPFALVDGKSAPAVSGVMTPEQALRQILQGTGLRVVPGADGGLVVQRDDQTEARDVRAPALPNRQPTQTAAAQVDHTSAGRGDLGGAVIEEVIVSAQKRDERLQDVPVAVTALSAQVLVQSNQVRIQDFAASVPGFTVSPSPSAGGQQMLSIRGISTGFNTNPTVGITVDDVPFGSSTNISGNTVPDIDPADLARVEVLRGPQGALYGASSMGGLLKFVTVDPSPDSKNGRLSAGLSDVHNGAEVGYSVRGSINLPVSDNFAVRLSGFTRRDPGYIDNPVLGLEGVNEATVRGGRASAMWEPSDAVSVKLSALYQKFKGDGTNDANVLPGFGDLQQNYPRGVGAFERQIQAYSVAINADVGSVDVTSLTGYNVNDFSDSFDFSYALGGLAQSLFGVSGAPVFTKSRTEKFTQEFRASIPLTDHVEWLLGGFYTHEDSPYSQDVQAVVPATGARIGRVLLVTDDPTYEEYAAFTDLTFTFSDRFDVQVGGRQTHIKRTATGAADATANAFTYLFTPRFKISPDLMVYARAASGYRAGGQNTNPDPLVPRKFDPDKTNNYELGIKGGTPDRSLSFDASLYYIDWKGLQLNLLNARNSQTFTTNVSRAKSEGAELTLEARPALGLTVAAAASWNNAVLTEDTGSAVAFGLDGDRLPFSAKFAGYMSIEQEFAISGDLDGLIGGKVSRTGSRIGSFISTPARERFPGFTTFDVRAALMFDAWVANAYVNNIADKRGVLGGGAGTFPPFAFSYIQPRTIGITVTRNF